ncbi:hypothetical protein GCM10022402_27900 [Salinactinospora qingdaonensis]|uniref:Uncharacterized protein n=1 Tax=Salinactinospora qingdaonensis TaxID=702744 RepID=A0ABP7FV30_9ACTN
MTAAPIRSASAGVRAAALAREGLTNGALALAAESGETEGPGKAEGRGKTEGA